MSAEQASLHQLTTAELLRMLQRADEEALQAAHAVAAQIERAVDALVHGWPEGGVRRDAAEQCLERTHGDIHRALVRAAEAS